MSLLESFFDALFNTPTHRGKVGESSAALRLGWCKFCGYDGKVMQNLYVPRSDNGTSEIDLLYITRKCIFVIESKNYSGYIFGNEHNRNWTQTLYAGKNWIGQKSVEKHSFYNPIWQNNTHIKYLLEFLKWDLPIISVIVFSNHCELKHIEVNSPGIIVCQQSNLSQFVGQVWRQHPDILSDNDIEVIYNRLLPLVSSNSQMKDVHVQKIHERFDNNVICPLCGGKLVLRTAHRGSHAGQQFLGCENYPKCRYTKNL